MGLFLRARLDLKEMLIRPIRKKPSLVVDNIGNYRPVTKISFLSKLVERVVADQLQALLDETNALDPFQLGFRPHHGTEMALVTLSDDLLRLTGIKCLCWSSSISQPPLIPSTMISS